MKINKKEEQISNPINIEYLKNPSLFSFSPYTIENSIIVFNSINNILYLIITASYLNKNDIISYNLVTNQKINYLLLSF